MSQSVSLILVVRFGSKIPTGNLQMNIPVRQFIRQTNSLVVVGVVVDHVRTGGARPRRDSVQFSHSSTHLFLYPLTHSSFILSWNDDGDDEDPMLDYILITLTWISISTCELNYHYRVVAVWHASYTPGQIRTSSLLFHCILPIESLPVNPQRLPSYTSATTTASIATQPSRSNRDINDRSKIICGK